MVRKLGRLFIVGALATSGSVIAGNFCAVTAMGANCNFPDLQSCYHHLAGVGGQCVANPQVLNPSQPQVQEIPRAAPYVPTLTPFNSTQSFQQGFERGQRQRHAREEHEAKMRLLEAQTTAARAPARDITIQPNNSYRATYACKADDGTVYTSQIPIVGCVVTSLDFGP